MTCNCPPAVGSGAVIGALQLQARSSPRGACSTSSRSLARPSGSPRRAPRPCKLISTAAPPTCPRCGRSSTPW
eukprot:1515317-Pyramimonas_sp.AAC.1